MGWYVLDSYEIRFFSWSNMYDADNQKLITFIHFFLYLSKNMKNDI
jgi:hypothetical protein